MMSTTSFLRLGRLPLLSLVPLLAFTLAASGQETPKRLLGYYTAWSKYNTPPYAAEQIPYSKLTHIAHAFVLLPPAADGTLGFPPAPSSPH